MTSSATTTDINWPAQDAELAKLFVPQGWLAGTEKQETCTIRYDSSRKLLKVLDHENSILDIINPADIIGCALEIKLLNGENMSSAPVANSKSDNPEAMQFDNTPKSLLPTDSKANAILKIFAYPQKDLSQSNSWLSFCRFGEQNTGPNPNPPSITGPFGNRYARHRCFQVAPVEDFIHINALIRAIREVSGLPTSPRKALLVLNPKSGADNGPQVLETFVRPMFEQASIDLNVYVTTHPLDATDRATKDDIGSFDSVVVMGGDGTFHEFLQGILAHNDSVELLRTLKLGIVGCGTGNGLAKSLTFAANEVHTHLESVFLIAKNNTTRIDLSRYESTNKEYLSFLTFSWAIIANVDIESKLISFLGARRFDVCAVWQTLRLRSYHARLSYLSPSKCDTSIDLASSIPKLTDPVPDNWDIIEDSFILFWASHVTHAGVNTFSSPPSRIDDGIFQILVVRGKWSRYQMTLLLLALETGTHVKSPAAEFIECVAYRLEPITSGSYNDLDGEEIEPGPIQAYIMPGTMQVFGQINR